MARKALTAAEKRKRSEALASDPEVLAERFKDYPAIDVISRRLMDPSDPGSLPILLKDEPADACTNTDHQNRMKPGATVCHLCKRPTRTWYVRWFNLAQEGRNAQMRAKGYLNVEIAELHDADDVADLFRSSTDRFVRRGDRGQEILGKQPLELFLAIKKRQREIRMADVISGKKIKSDLAEAAGAELGDEAGQSIHDGAIKIESVKRERSTLGEEAELEALAD